MHPVFQVRSVLKVQLLQFSGLLSALKAQALQFYQPRSIEWLGSSVVECSHGKRETLGSSPGRATFFFRPCDIKAQLLKFYQLSENTHLLDSICSVSPQLFNLGRHIRTLFKLYVSSPFPPPGEETD